MVVYSTVLAQPEAWESCGREMRWNLNEVAVALMRVKIALNYINDQWNILCLYLGNVPKSSLNA
jgi:hypothetical protein